MIATRTSLPGAHGLAVVPFLLSTATQASKICEAGTSRLYLTAMSQFW
jgi:hypothetical protein